MNMNLGYWHLLLEREFLIDALFTAIAALCPPF